MQQFDQLGQPFNGQVNVGIEILEMIVAPSGTYADQWTRPYQTNSTGPTVQAIQERFDQVQGNFNALNNGLFDGVAGGFVSPQAQPEQQIMIPNGWGTERYYFILKVAIHNRLGGTSIDIIQGYSDFADPSFNNLPDPRTRFIINGISRVVNTIIHGSYGRQEAGMVKESYQILANPNYNGPQDFSNFGSASNTSVSMRPGDIFSSLHTSEYTTSDLVDMRTATTSSPKTSARGNAVAANYAGQIVRGYAEAVTKAGYSPGGSHLYSDAIGVVADKPLTRDEFVKAINSVTGMPLSNSFQLQDLYSLDPSLQNSMDQRIKIQRKQQLVPSYRNGGGFAFGDMPTSGNAQHWHGSDYDTQAAAVLSNSLPAMMLELGVVHLVFQATNHSRQPVIQTIFAQGIADNFDCRPLMPTLESRIQREIIDTISGYNQIMYQIYVDVKVAAQTTISVQFENKHPSEFVSPTFADSLMSPVLTGDRGRLSDVACDFGTLVNHLVQVQSPSLESLGGFADI